MFQVGVSVKGIFTVCACHTVDSESQLSLIVCDAANAVTILLMCNRLAATLYLGVRSNFCSASTT